MTLTEISQSQNNSTSLYDVPSTGLGGFKHGGKTAAIIGAGPGGLTAALTAKEEGYDNVIVFEKRAAFSRMNVINLHPESRHIFQRLNILDRFLSRASPIMDHRNHVFANGAELYNFRDPGREVDVNPEHTFEADDVRNGFRNETQYSISLADLQDLLATIACERGVRIIAEAQASLTCGRDDMHSVRADVAGCQVSVLVNRPQLVVIAEGAGGATCRELGGQYDAADSLWPNENWVFGNYTCLPSYGFSHLLFEFNRDCDDVTISNCIFLPRRREVNVAVTVKNPEMRPEQIRELVTAQAQKILKVSGVARSSDRLSWHSQHVVKIAPRSADRCHFGKNVVVLGDATGANSPVAALGGTLSTSAYSYAIRQLIRDLDALPPEEALSRYGDRARAYVSRWHSKVTEIRRILELEIRCKSRQLAACTVEQPTAIGGAL